MKPYTFQVKIHHLPHLTADELAAEKLKRELTEEKHLENATTLKCDKCGSLIGWVYESDLNGSYFYCFDCKPY